MKEVTKAKAKIPMISIFNAGAQMHTPHGVIGRGQVEIAVSDWEKMEKLPKIGLAIKEKRMAKVSDKKAVAGKEEIKK